MQNHSAIKAAASFKFKVSFQQINNHYQLDGYIDIFGNKGAELEIIYDTFNLF